MRHLRLTGRAARFVQLLHDYGHLEFDEINRLIVGVGDVVPEGEKVDLADVRRAAAMLLFPSGDEANDSGALAEDWPILFA